MSEYTPPSSGNKKPVSKKQLRKLQEAYLHADAIHQETRKKEHEENKQILPTLEQDIENFL